MELNMYDADEYKVLKRFQLQSGWKCRVVVEVSARSEFRPHYRIRAFRLYWDGNGRQRYSAYLDRREAEMKIALERSAVAYSEELERSARFDFHEDSPTRQAA